MRARLKKTMIDINDTGIIPEPMFAELAKDFTISDYATRRKKYMPALIGQAFEATARDPENIGLFISKLRSADPLQRYWAVQGCLILGKAASSAEDALTKTLTDNYSAIRVAAAQSLIRMGKIELGKSALIKELNTPNNVYSQLNLINSLTQLDLLNSIPEEWVDKTLKNKNAGQYVIRLAQRIKDLQKKSP